MSEEIKNELDTTAREDADVAEEPTPVEEQPAAEEREEKAHKRAKKKTHDKGTYYRGFYSSCLCNIHQRLRHCERRGHKSAYHTGKQHGKG